MQLKLAVEKERSKMREEFHATTSRLQKCIDVLEKEREDLRRRLNTAEAHTLNTKSSAKEGYFVLYIYQFYKINY